jgi:hypothetical protein
MDFAACFAAAHRAIECHRFRLHAGAGERVAEQELVGYIAEADTTLAAVGLAPEAWKWTVSFRSELWPHATRIDRGAVIDADPSPAHRWPRLTVQEASVVEGIVRLKCSSEEVVQ